MIWFQIESVSYCLARYDTLWNIHQNGQSFEDDNIYVTTTNNKYTKSFNISLLNKIVRKNALLIKLWFLYSSSLLDLWFYQYRSLPWHLSKKINKRRDVICLWLEFNISLNMALSDSFNLQGVLWDANP